MGLQIRNDPMPCAAQNRSAASSDSALAAPRFREPTELLAPGQPRHRRRRGGAELDGLRAELTAEAEAQTACHGRGLALLWPRRILRAASSWPRLGSQHYLVAPQERRRPRRIKIAIHRRRRRFQALRRQPGLQARERLRLLLRVAPAAEAQHREAARPATPAPPPRHRRAWARWSR